MKRRAALVGIGGIVSLAGCTARSPFGRSDETERLDERGDIEIVIDGSPVDLSADRFQAEHADNHSIQFHLHEGSDNWYMEGERRVTAAEAVDLLPHFEYSTVNESHVITFDRREYDEGDPGTDVTFLVGGEEIEPTEYELRDGDHLRVEITAGEG